MPFLIVSENEYQKELDKITLPKNNEVESHKISNEEIITSIEQNTINYGLEVEEIKKGRGAGVTNMPECLRAVIAEEKLTGSTAKEVENAFGVSPSSIAAYAHGNTSCATYNKPVDKLVQVRTRISNRAANRLNSALKSLANKNLDEEKAKDLSSIAKDMAVVFDKLSPVKAQEHADENKHLHLHMYAPKMKTLADYEIIDLNQKAE